MNKYIISKEALQVEGKEQNFIVSALYTENKKMIEVTLNPVENPSILGNIYIGRVENIVKNLNSAFVKISPEQNCYFPLSELRRPLFTKKLSTKKEIVIGEELVVQVEKEALKTKDPSVTTNLTFTGKYVVLTTGNQKKGVSSKLGKKEKERFQNFFLENQERDYGLIFRTNAKNASDEQIWDEIRTLENQWNAMKQAAPHRTCYSCLLQNTNAYISDINNFPEGSIDEIITDDITIFRELCDFYGVSESEWFSKGAVSELIDTFCIEDDLKIRYYQDSLLSLSSLYGIKSSLSNALREHVWLKSGAYLIIQPTEALTVIDVNSGKNIIKKEKEENFLKINLEAVKEIGNQLRLRNISGIIIVDFINMKSEDHNNQLLQELRSVFKADPVKTEVIGMTKLGLVEITRKKIKKSLLDSLKNG